MTAFGIGGPKLQAEGLESVVDARELLAMGFVEILGRLPRVFRALNQVTDEASKRLPDVAVVIDYPEFHFKLARRLGRLGIPVVCYIPPKVWVWRKKRIALLRSLFARVLTILPFEEDFYRREGLSVKYVGNPLQDELPFGLTQAQARERLFLQAEDLVLVVMPGSRPAELKRHLDLMILSAERVAEDLFHAGKLPKSKKLEVLVPFPATAAIPSSFRERKVSPKIRTHVSQGDAHACLVAADVGMIKSGTSTLEAALLGCPHTVIYKPSRISGWIVRHLIRYHGPVSLVNLIAGHGVHDRQLVHEILCEEVSVQNVSQEVTQLFLDSEKRTRMREGFREVRELTLHRDRRSPSDLAAAEVIAVVSQNQALQNATRSSSC